MALTNHPPFAPLNPDGRRFRSRRHRPRHDADAAFQRHMENIRAFIPVGLPFEDDYLHQFGAGIVLAVHAVSHYSRERHRREILEAKRRLALVSTQGSGRSTLFSRSISPPNVRQCTDGTPR